VPWPLAKPTKATANNGIKTNCRFIVSLLIL
jgi:hypothetical protein